VVLFSFILIEILEKVKCDVKVMEQISVSISIR
jgi:hypothetical protein